MFQSFVLVRGFDMFSYYLPPYSFFSFVCVGESGLVVYLDFLRFVLLVVFGVPVVHYSFGLEVDVLLAESIVYQYVCGAFSFTVDCFQVLQCVRALLI